MSLVGLNRPIPGWMVFLVFVGLGHSGCAMPQEPASPNLVAPASPPPQEHVDCAAFGVPSNFNNGRGDWGTVEAHRLPAGYAPVGVGVSERLSGDPLVVACRQSWSSGGDAADGG